MREDSAAKFESGIYSREVGGPTAELQQIEDSFIEAWARMAGAFAMDAMMGRVHALIYLAPEAIGAEAVSDRLGLPGDLVEMYIETLVDWNLVFATESGYVAEQDPWTWFVRTVRARQGRELIPIRNAVEAVRDAARQLVKASGSPGVARIKVVVSRIERFTSFVTDFSKLIDAFVTLGAAPMLKFVSLTTRLVPRRAA